MGSKWGYTYTAGWRIDAPVLKVKDLSIGTLGRQYKRIASCPKRLPEEVLQSALSHGFPRHSENRGVPGSIPGLASCKDACTSRGFAEAGKAV